MTPAVAKFHEYDELIATGAMACTASDQSKIKPDSNMTAQFPNRFMPSTSLSVGARARKLAIK